MVAGALGAPVGGAGVMAVRGGLGGLLRGAVTSTTGMICKREMTDVRQTWMGEEWMMTPGHEQVVVEE